MLLVISPQKWLPCLVLSLSRCHVLRILGNLFILKTPQPLCSSIYMSVKGPLHHATYSNINLAAQDSTETFPTPPLCSSLSPNFRQTIALKNVLCLGFPELPSVMLLILDFGNHSCFKPVEARHALVPSAINSSVEQNASRGDRTRICCWVPF